MGSTLHISQLADRAQVPVSTVRYYERIGLLGPAERSENGYRVYDESTVEHLAFIGRAKRMGMPLEQVAELIELWSTGGCRPLQERIRSFLAGRILEVRAQRTELATFEWQLHTLSARIDSRPGSPGLCELDCACVHLDETEETDETDDAASGCARFPTASRETGTACSLDGEDQVGRAAEWREVLGDAEVVEWTPRGLRMAFAPSAEIAGRLARLSAAEVACCPFFEFSVDVSADAVVLQVGAPDTSDAQALTAHLFGIAPQPVAG